MKDKTRDNSIIDITKKTDGIIPSATVGENLLFPLAGETESIQFPDSSCGNQGDHKILIAYASEFGTTREVADVIGKILCQGGGATVEIKWVKNVKDLKNYEAVIIGSAIQYDKWMPDAIKFVMTYQNILSKLPVAFFFTCLTLSKQTEKARHTAMAYSDKLYSLLPQVKPISVGGFAGVLDYGKMSLGFRLIAKGIYAIFGVLEGDYRDWDAIHFWAKNVHSKLNLKLMVAEKET